MDALQNLVHAATPARRPTMLRTCCLILCLVAGTRQLNITEFEVPLAVETGGSAELRCQFSQDANDLWMFVKWWWTPMYGADDNPKLLYQRLAGRNPEASRSNIDVLGNDTIIVRNMEYTDSGKYECEVSGDTEKRVHEELVVFSNGTGPILNISRTADGPDKDSDDDVAIECQAYGVTPQPDLVISIGGVNKEATNEITNSSEGLFDATVNITVSKAEVPPGEQIRCDLYYVNTNVKHPDYYVVVTTPGAGLSTTEAVEDTTQLGATSDSLQNYPDASIAVYGSWILVAAAIPIHFYNLV